MVIYYHHVSKLNIDLKVTDIHKEKKNYYGLISFSDQWKNEFYSLQ